MISFTNDHFSNNIPRWKKHVIPRFNGKECNALFIGPCEGRAPIWFLENLPNAHAMCIERFEEKTFTLFKQNIRGFKNRCKYLNMSFKDGLIKLHSKTPNQFDFVFIDTANSKEVLEALVLAYPLLKFKGLLIVDDYTNSKEHISNCPKPAVDSFMNIYAPYMKALEFSWQAILLKRSKPLPWHKCNSEYYHEDLDRI